MLKRDASSLFTELQLKLLRKIFKLNLKDLEASPMPTTAARDMLSSPMKPRRRQNKLRKC